MDEIERLTRAVDRREKVRAAIAGVTGCPYEWVTEDGNTHLCYLLSAVEHNHMCQCGAFAPQAGQAGASP